MSRKAEISRRLKAARWLAGGVDEEGKPRALKNAELAQRELLVENGITANRLEEIEQMKVVPPPMELEQLAAALGVERDWFEGSATRGERALEQLRRALEDLGLAPGPSTGEEPTDEDEEDRPDQAEGGAGA